MYDVWLGWTFSYLKSKTSNVFSLVEIFLYSLWVFVYVHKYETKILSFIDYIRQGTLFKRSKYVYAHVEGCLISTFLLLNFGFVGYKYILQTFFLNVHMGKERIQVFIVLMIWNRIINDIKNLKWFRIMTLLIPIDIMLIINY